MTNHRNPVADATVTGGYYSASYARAHMALGFRQDDCQGIDAPDFLPLGSTIEMAGLPVPDIGMREVMYACARLWPLDW